MVTARARLASRAARKAHWCWWMARYWAMDKYNAECRATAFWLSLVVGTTCAIALLASALGYVPPPAPGEPRAAWWVQLVIMLVSFLISYAMRPKPQEPKPAEGQAPTVEDGAALDRIYGRVWTDDGNWTAWLNGEPEPIRKKAGKK